MVCAIRITFAQASKTTLHAGDGPLPIVVPFMWGSLSLFSPSTLFYARDYLRNVRGVFVLCVIHAVVQALPLKRTFHKRDVANYRNCRNTKQEPQRSVLSSGRLFGDRRRDKLYPVISRHEPRNITRWRHDIIR